MKIMMFAHGGSENRGCEAIVRSTTQLIKGKMKGAKVYLTSERPCTDNMIVELDDIYSGEKCTIKKYSWNGILSAIRFKAFADESYALSKIEHNTIKHVKNMDVFLSIGGDNYCYGEQPGLYEINKRVKASGKKLVLWGCSIGEEDLSDKKIEDLRNFDLILARETMTYQLLEKINIKNVKLCADAAFTLKNEKLKLPNGWYEGNTLGLNFSPLVKRRNKGSQKAVGKLINHILNTTDMTIALTPHVTQYGNNDYEILSDYYQEFKNTGRIIILPDHLNAMQYKGYMARMRFFVGARTHATIASYSNCIPTMVLGYSVKSRGIARDIFGEEKLVLNIKELSDDKQLKAKFDELVRDEDEIKEKLQREIPNIQNMSYKAVEYLNNLAESG